MSVEIERKFLITGPFAKKSLGDGSRIEQGYVAIEPGGAEVRVRRVNGRCLLTIKSGRGIKRTEVEFTAPAGVGMDLWKLTNGRRIEKTRHRLRLGGRTAEIDVYRGALRGLVIAEVEFSSEVDASAFEPPSWFGMDVTDDPRYKNQSLAVCGVPHRRRIAPKRERKR